MLGCCSDTLSVMVSLGMYQLPSVGADSVLVCKPLELVNEHLSTRLETRTKESNACVSFRVALSGNMADACMLETTLPFRIG